MDSPLDNPDMEEFTDGSSFVRDGKRKAGYAVVPAQQVLEAKSLPQGTSAQLGELVSLTRALSSVQFSTVAQLCPTLSDPMNHSMPGLPVHHQLLEFTQTHVHKVSDAIQPFHPLFSTAPPASNPSQHQGLFQLVNTLHQVAKVLEFQLHHQSFQ